MVKSFKIGLAVETQYQRVTDRRTDGRMDRRTPHDGKDRALQSVARVKTVFRRHVMSPIISETFERNRNEISPCNVTMYDVSRSYYSRKL